MAKKKKSRPAEPARAGNRPVEFNPFKDLKKMIAARAAEQPAEIPKPAPKPPAAAASATGTTAPEDEDALLREAMAGVRPIAPGGNARMPIDPPLNHTIVSEDDEVIAQLSDLVSGHAPFDITETEEYVEGMRVGLDPRLITRLRRGEFAVQHHIDLHGMTQSAAKEALTAFILESVRKGLRAVLVVHGRGLGSPGGRPVLKHGAANWLSHGTIGGHVLAFASARPHDGGAGATYVLLRRDRRRAPFEVLHGAKRRD
jgi:DNA-nicking Smr family endonuclease